MKYKLLGLLAVLALLTSCAQTQNDLNEVNWHKQNNWIDWRIQNEAFLLDNLQNEGVVESDSKSGLQYKILYEGNPTDAQPTQAALVVVDYTGRLINGAVFDHASGAQLSVSQLVKGFQEGLTKMHVHGDAIFYVPYTLGYDPAVKEYKDGVGTEGTASFIPPYSTLIFEVHLCAVISD